MNEFSIIEKFFKKQAALNSTVIKGIGDDCALLSPPSGQALAVSTDTLVAGVHFFHDTPPQAIGHKSLAVNLSDLAAMGATPAWATLSLTLPHYDKKWLASFCKGFFSLAHAHGLSLVGGDLTHGPLSITIQVIGFVPAKQALARDRAQDGDFIYVSGPLGDAKAALAISENHLSTSLKNQSALMKKLHYPVPKIELGLALRGYAHAAIDISDGLIGDLGHILKASAVGATLFVEQIPLSATLKKIISLEKARRWALEGGDDYELCFTAKKTAALQKIAKQYSCVPIGRIESKKGLRICNDQGQRLSIPNQSYRHF